MISMAHVNALLTGGLTRALADLYFNNPKTFMNSGANGGSVSATVGQIAMAHAAFPDASQNWLFNSFGPNELTGAPGIDGVFGPGGVYGPGTTLPPYLVSVSYDPEGPTSNGTPQSECDALEEGDLSDVTQAALLVHARGLKFLFTPSVDVGMSGSQARPYPNKYSTYLSQRRGAWAATPGIDVFAIQSQQAEGTPLWIVRRIGTGASTCGRALRAGSRWARYQSAQSTNRHLDADARIGVRTGPGRRRGGLLAERRNRQCKRVSVGVFRLLRPVARPYPLRTDAFRPSAAGRPFRRDTGASQGRSRNARH